MSEKEQAIYDEGFCPVCGGDKVERIPYIRGSPPKTHKCPECGLEFSIRLRRLKIAEWR